MYVCMYKYSGSRLSGRGSTFLTKFLNFTPKFFILNHLPKTFHIYPPKNFYDLLFIFLVIDHFLGILLLLKEIQTARLCEDRKEGHFQWWQMYVSMHTQVTHIVGKYMCMHVSLF